MNSDRIRDALWLAAAGEPQPYDRATAALNRAARRRRTKIVGVSCATAVAAVVASVTLSGASGPSSLHPVPVTSPTGTVRPAPGDEPSPTAEPTHSPGPDGAPGRGGGRPSRGDATATPMCDHDGITAPCGATIVRLPRPQNIDVFVLLDATGSMFGAKLAADAVVRRLDQRLRADGSTIGWGFGYYRDTGPLDHDDQTDTRAYRTVQRVRVSSVPDLSQTKYFGGGDTPDAATFGLDAVLGTGHFPYSSDADFAGFRLGAHKIVLLITDAPIKQGDAYPAIDDVLARLNAADVDVVGLHAITGLEEDGNEDAARADLERVVRGTGALTPVAVDCDGEPGKGVSDLAPGDPLVCPLYDDMPDADAYADALLAMVRAGR